MRRGRGEALTRKPLELGAGAGEALEALRAAAVFHWTAGVTVCDWRVDVFIVDDPLEAIDLVLVDGVWRQPALK